MRKRTTVGRDSATQHAPSIATGGNRQARGTKYKENRYLARRANREAFRVKTSRRILETAMRAKTRPRYSGHLKEHGPRKFFRARRRAPYDTKQRNHSLTVNRGSYLQSSTRTARRTQPATRKSNSLGTTIPVLGHRGLPRNTFVNHFH